MVVQNTPNAASSTPTPNFRPFSGTRTSGRRSSMPTASTSTQAAAAPSDASAISPCPAPTASTSSAAARQVRATPLRRGAKVS